MTNLIEVFRKRLRVLMAEADMSATKLADEANLSVDSVRKYLRGEMTPTFETIFKLSEALNCTPNDLCGFAEVQKQETTA